MLKGDRGVREHLKFAGQKGSIVEAALNVLMMWNFTGAYCFVNSALNIIAKKWNIERGWIDWEIKNIADNGFGRPELEDNNALQHEAKGLLVVRNRKKQVKRLK